MVLETGVPLKMHRVVRVRQTGQGLMIGRGLQRGLCGGDEAGQDAASWLFRPSKLSAIGVVPGALVWG